MTTLTTNRFLTKALRTLCLAGALSTCSAWATVVTWQLSPSGMGATKALFQSGFTASRGFDNTAVTDASRQFLFKAGSESGSTRDTDIQRDSRPTLSQVGGQSLAGSKQSDESLLFATSNTPARPATELDEALARNSFDEEFVSVPTVQFASIAPGSRDLSMASGAGGGVGGNADPAPVPEMSALFPIVGLIVAVSCTQILRRRRAAQQGAFRHLA